MIRSYALAAATGLAIFTSVNAWPADPLPTETHKSLPLELAVEAAQAAIAACKAQGYNVTVTVADVAVGSDTYTGVCAFDPMYGVIV